MWLRLLGPLRVGDQARAKHGTRARPTRPGSALNVLGGLCQGNEDRTGTARRLHGIGRQWS
jgi:hypothetical protein